MRACVRQSLLLFVDFPTVSVFVGRSCLTKVGWECCFVARFHKMVDAGESFTAMDYTAPTPYWAVYGAAERGMDPEENRWYHNRTVRRAKVCSMFIWLALPPVRASTSFWLNCPRGLLFPLKNSVSLLSFLPKGWRAV